MKKWEIIKRDSKVALAEYTLLGIGAFSLLGLGWLILEWYFSSAGSLF